MKALAHLNKYFKKYWQRIFWGVLFISASNYFAVQAVTYIGEGIDYLRGINPTHAPENFNNHLATLALWILGFTLLQGFFMFLMRQAIIVMSRLIEFDLKNEIFVHYQKLDMAFYKRNNTGDLMNRISEDVGRVRMYIGPSIMYIVNTVMTFMFTVGKMIQIDYMLTLYVLTPLPILTLLIYLVSDKLNKKGTIVQDQLSKLSTIAQESFAGIRVIKAYAHERFAGNLFSRESEVYKSKNMSLVKTESLFQPFMIMLIGLSTILTIYIGGKENIDGKISLGNIAEFIVYINRLTWPVASLGWVTSLVQRAAASQKRINEFLDTQPSIKNTNVSPLQIKGSIEFNNVTFTYPDSGITALKNISFNIKAGETLAIVGRTGSGKSTIANLICRLYDVDAGEIKIDGNKISTLNLYELRTQIGYVPQEVFLFSDTIGNNIAFSYFDSEEIKKNTLQIENAARNAAIYNNIIEFPHKFETVVGERGITLSGGQKQRVSIARAIIKTPQVLIFDDCLSAVDTETEEEILGNLKSIMLNKTTIIISHRISSVQHANKILVLDKGEIVETGTHNELLAAKGVYAELYSKQLLEKE